MKKYRHYKGGIYTFICVATHTETDEKFVIYENQAGDIWARPYVMFFGKVEVDEAIVDRFSIVEHMEDSHETDFT